MVTWRRHIKNLIIALLITMLNLAFALRIGLAYGSFDWLRYAGVYGAYQVQVLYSTYFPFVTK